MPSAEGVHASRRASRERVIEILYESEAKDTSPVEVLDSLPVQPDDYTCAVIRGITESIDSLNQIIVRLARNWSLERMPAVDRAILRMGLFELSARSDVPTAVILNEAVELASEYSTDDSGRFVNGLLAAAAAELRGADGD